MALLGRAPFLYFYISTNNTNYNYIIFASSGMWTLVPWRHVNKKQMLYPLDHNAPLEFTLLLGCFFARKKVFVGIERGKLKGVDFSQNLKELFRMAGWSIDKLACSTQCLIVSSFKFCQMTFKSNYTSLTPSGAIDFFESRL